jgi:hypothetical protein
MKINVFKRVEEPDKVFENCEISLESQYVKDKNEKLDCSKCIAYPPLINSHDHLVGNWYPRNGDNRPYPNSDVWVHEMKFAKTFLERNKVWINNGKFQLLEGTAPLLTTLGIYKNIASGCYLVQDHASKQKDAYYENFPIRVLKEYTQCHSISIGNWWGDKTPEEEMAESQGKMPFILHLAEGIDEKAFEDFSELKRRGLFKSNTLMIHAIALTRDEIEEVAEMGASVCWCPESNHFLIGRSIDVPYCLESGVKVVLGTDSTQSGSFHILNELKAGHKMFPQISAKDLYKMITIVPQKTLFLEEWYGKLPLKTSDLLLIRKKHNDPFENLLSVDFHDIELFVYQGKPIYGNADFLEYFAIDENDYYKFKHHSAKRFIIGHPEKTLEKIDELLGYHKNFPFLPF